MTTEYTGPFAASLKRRAAMEKRHPHPGGCTRLLNAGVCGLDFYGNGKPVVCRYCKAIDKKDKENENHNIDANASSGRVMSGLLLGRKVHRRNART